MPTGDGERSGGLCGGISAMSDPDSTASLHERVNSTSAQWCNLDCRQALGYARACWSLEKRRSFIARSCSRPLRRVQEDRTLTVHNRRLPTLRFSFASPAVNERYGDITTAGS